LLLLIAWRLLRADAWPAWWAAPLGFVNDLILGNPIGLSVALWAAMMIAMDILDRRTQWRDYWIEWVLAAVLIAMDEWLQWRVAKAVYAAPSPRRRRGPAIVVGILCFPGAFLAAQIDR
jgi:rod shape-determining protein MreD